MSMGTAFCGPSFRPLPLSVGAFSLASKLLACQASPLARPADLREGACCRHWEGSLWLQTWRRVPAADMGGKSPCCCRHGGGCLCLPGPGLDLVFLVSLCCPAYTFPPWVSTASGRGRHSPGSGCQASKLRCHFMAMGLEASYSAFRNSVFCM